MKLLLLLVLASLCAACNSSNGNGQSYGTPQDCAAAGGQCMLGPGVSICAKRGPENTCNCNPGCNPGGGFCCLALIDGGDAEAAAPDAGVGD